ncbi:MAG: hypothetical protein ACD_2C00050G0005 [uncultured bacterium (gcode 4)]|uniref:Uncharacterized protein n=1 Tax=uncultured bacterium (gcode 4) TaxID=1234023 RepID=K2H2G4_9BACT|nr:MAG: hypothetical protein ACD_2C00050G0005 [uncultured bacterium (gcode 4)]
MFLIKVSAKDPALREKAFSEADRQMERIFADIYINFANQAFMQRKQDALSDAEITKKIIEEEIGWNDLSSIEKKLYRRQLKHLDKGKWVTQCKSVCESIDAVQDRFLNEALDMKELHDIDMLEKIMWLAQKSFDQISRLWVFSVLHESDIVFKEWMNCIKASYEFLRWWFDLLDNQTKSVRARISEIIMGEAHIESKRKSIFMWLELALVYLNDLTSKKEAQVEEMDSEILKLKEELKIISSRLREADLWLRQTDKSIEALKAQVVSKTAALTASNANLTKSKKENDELRAQNETLIKELEELRKLKEKVQSWNLCANDGTFWQEMALDLETQHSELAAKMELMETKSVADTQKITSLETTLEDIYRNHLDRATACRIKCEQDLQRCDADDMIWYIAYWNCTMDIKQDCADEIMKFFDFFLENTSKWASSWMNVQSASMKWKWNWKFANNFINPIINFLRETYNKKWTQAFLEKIANIEWKKLLEEYRWWDINVQSTKKHIVISDVYKNISDEEAANKSLFEALSVLPVIFERIDKWDVDLTSLRNNIKEALSASNLSKKLSNLLKEAIKN